MQCPYEKGLKKKKKKKWSTKHKAENKQKLYNTNTSPGM